MSVGVGSLQDPKDFNGIAHFLEHMLFLGTDKYPVAGEYKEFLSRNGGTCNAYTSETETNYYFQVKDEGLEGALDRFSQFFISP
jgi:secreted Zn-dependent insulinase-like peptidase